MILEFVAHASRGQAARAELTAKGQEFVALRKKIAEAKAELADYNFAKANLVQEREGKVTEKMKTLASIYAVYGLDIRDIG